jgi:hypothetical protein
MNLTRYGLIATLSLALLAPTLSQADRHDDRDHRNEHYDVRHGHNHYYPARGFEVRAVPHEARVVVWGGERLWFHEGVWYRPHGHGFVVIAPPFGVFVPVLPAFATLVVLGGIQYYYANEAYYRYYPEQGGYQVVAPPEGEAGPPGQPPPNGGPPMPPPSDNIFIYPKNGQPPEQQARDRYECHRWAADQTSFDPTRPAGGVPPEVAASKRADYMRAQQACLEARGYTVR